MSASKSSPFVALIDLNLADKLLADLKQQNFEISRPPYTVFAAKKKGISCALYQSGKLTVQGKEMKHFLEFYLEPEILKNVSFTYPQLSLDLTPRIGIDESGKGDFFGPLCIAGVFAEKGSIEQLHAWGVKDSKSLSDEKILSLGERIRALCPYHLVKINPLKYNELHRQFGNLNRLLAWGHATAIEKLSEQTGCAQVIVDQFADERVVLNALARKNLEISLTQRHRAEEDIVVAAASILARCCFLSGLKELSQSLGVHLPKGASASVIRAGKEVARRWGEEGLAKAAKMHFKTLGAIRENH